MMQEKQIRAKQSIKQLSSKWQTQRTQVADQVKKRMQNGTGIIPKVSQVHMAELKPALFQNESICFCLLRKNGCLLVSMQQKNM